MIIVVVGPSGSGKGVQAKLLAKEFDLTYVSMGNLLRKAAKKDKKIDEIINKKGKLAPAEITISILKDYLSDEKINKNIILDGSPRTVDQFKLLAPWLKEKGKKIDLVLVLKVGEKELFERLSGRRMDPDTNKIYNIYTSPKPGPEVDVDTLIHRDDDKPEKIKERLSWYKNEVVPFIKHMKENGVNVVEVDGERPINVIQKDLRKIVKGTVDK